MQSAVSLLLWLARYAGGGIVAFATPRLLVAAGVPLDSWIVEMGHAVSIHIDSEAAIWLATLVLGTGLYIGSVILSGRNKWTPDVPGPLIEIFRDTPAPTRVLLIIVVFALGGASIQIWRLSEQAVHSNGRSAATALQLQRYYVEAEEHRRSALEAQASSDEEFKAVEKEAHEWSEALGHWIIDNMGWPAYVRLIKLPPTPPPQTNRAQLLLMITMVRDNLEKLIENPAWDKQ